MVEEFLTSICADKTFVPIVATFIYLDRFKKWSKVVEEFLTSFLADISIEKLSLLSTSICADISFEIIVTI